MSKPLKAFLVAGCCTVLLTGCWDRTEINDIAFVSCTAIDQDKDGFRLTVQVPVPSQLGGMSGVGAGGGGQGIQSFFTAEGTGPTIRAANMEQQKNVSRELYFSHRRVVLIGEGLAKKGIETMLDLIGRLPQNRLTSHLLITEGNAGPYLKLKAPMEKIPAEFYREKAEQSSQTPMTIREIANILLTNGVDPAIPYLSMNNGEGSDKKEGTTIHQVSLKGFALFHQDKMKGVLTGEDATGLLWAKGQVIKANINVEAPEGEGLLSLQVERNQVKMDSTVVDDQIEIRIRLSANAVLVENQSLMSLSNSKNVAAVEEAVNRKVEAQVSRTIGLLQKLGSDAVGFGDQLHRKHPALWQRLGDRWETLYPKAKVTVQANIHIEHAGTIMKPFGIKENKLLK